MADDRKCQGCGAVLPRRMPRERREDGILVCPHCMAHGSQPGWGSTQAATGGVTTHPDLDGPFEPASHTADTVIYHHHGPADGRDYDFAGGTWLHQAGHLTGEEVAELRRRMAIAQRDIIAARPSSGDGTAYPLNPTETADHLQHEHGWSEAEVEDATPADLPHLHLALHEMGQLYPDNAGVPHPRHHHSPFQRGTLPTTSADKSPVMVAPCGCTFEGRFYSTRDCSVVDNDTWTARRSGQHAMRAKDHAVPADPSIRSPRTGLSPSESTLRAVAHESDDDASALHCPFCGSGQTLGRSDGTIQCGYCQRTYTVRLQPDYPAMPQEIDGQPNPAGMPGVAQASGEEETEEPAPEEQTNSPDEETTDGDQMDEEKATTRGASASLRTAAGDTLSYDQYLRHLAVVEVSAEDPRRQDVLRAVRADVAARF